MKFYIFHFLIFLCLLDKISYSQHGIEDFELIILKDLDCIDTSNYSKINPGNDTKILKLKHKGIIANYNPISLIFKGIMLTYQRMISPQLYNKCLYDISCSNFSKKSIQEFGLVKGVFLSADRLMRCNSRSRRESPSYLYNPETRKIHDHPSKYRIR